MNQKIYKKGYYYIKTFGCQMNVNDSEYIAGQLEDMGYQATQELHYANIIILNTCCVRAKVEHKIYSMAGKVSQIIRKKPSVIFGICGCLAQKEKENLIHAIPRLDLIFGPSQASSIKDIIVKSYIENNKKPLIHCNNRSRFKLNALPVKHYNPISAFVQIMKGCNNFCSYCIVPYTRGPEESRKSIDILQEIKQLVQNNYKEIFLLGQNVNSYQSHDQTNQKENFVHLLKKISHIPKLHRIRFTTSHPKDFLPDLINTIKNEDKICEHIHLPIQSGSDTILKKMNRKYNMDQYLKIIDSIRKNIPESSITTDVMVGFPGETEKDFEHTLEAFKRIRFDSAFTFLYSNREHSLASYFEKQVPENIKKKRLWKLIELQKSISLDINQK